MDTINSDWKLKLNKFRLKVRQILLTDKEISYDSNIPRTLIDSQTVKCLDTFEVCFYRSRLDGAGSPYGLKISTESRTWPL